MVCHDRGRVHGVRLGHDNVGDRGLIRRSDASDPAKDQKQSSHAATTLFRTPSPPPLLSPIAMDMVNGVSHMCFATRILTRELYISVPGLH